MAAPLHAATDAFFARLSAAHARQNIRPCFTSANYLSAAGSSPEATPRGECEGILADARSCEGASKLTPTKQLPLLIEIERLSSGEEGIPRVLLRLLLAVLHYEIADRLQRNTVPVLAVLG